MQRLSIEGNNRFPVWSPDGRSIAFVRYDGRIQAMSGIMSITGHAGGGPVRVGIAINDTSAGLLLANGIVLALLDRERTELRFNSEWFGAMTAADMIKLAAQHTVARMLERETDWHKRRPAFAATPAP